MAQIKILKSDTLTYNTFLENKKIKILLEKETDEKGELLIDENNEQYIIIDFEPATPKKVFLGGSIYKSFWREDLISNLNIDFFNPYLDQWDDSAQLNIEKEKELCDFRLYVITNSNSSLSIAEAIDDSNKYPEKTIFCILQQNSLNRKLNIDDRSMVNLNKIKEIIKKNGACCFEKLEDVSNYLNTFEI